MSSDFTSQLYQALNAYIKKKMAGQNLNRGTIFKEVIPTITREMLSGVWGGGNTGLALVLVRSHKCSDSAPGC